MTSTDYVPALLERGAERAEAERLAITFRRPTPRTCRSRTRRFDVVLSTFGVMFTPDQEQAAGELLRVCRPGGRIGLANWTPDGFIGQLFKTIGKHVPPPAGVRSPALWGTRGAARELFGAKRRRSRDQRQFVFRYRSPEHWLEVFRDLLRPGAQGLRRARRRRRRRRSKRDLRALLDNFNTARDGTVGGAQRLPRSGRDARERNGEAATRCS